MNVIWPHVPADDVNVVGLADSTDEIAKTTRNIPSKNWLAVLGDEHEVVVQQRDGTCSSRRSTASILKASPKGEGFHPSLIGALITNLISYKTPTSIWLIIKKPIKQWFVYQYPGRLLSKSEYLKVIWDFFGVYLQFIKNTQRW